MRGFTCWGQFVSMLFCQLGRAHSLREITNGLRNPFVVQVFGVSSNSSSNSSPTIACWYNAHNYLPRGKIHKYFDHHTAAYIVSAVGDRFLLGENSPRTTIPPVARGRHPNAPAFQESGG
ncbi:MAG: hypothetical protein FD159_688 [Syntrophaceae bacterium]|nr:MAG: hypothetical protein FD159_688 [Syntrophaceae bacterium]